jgi:hypothetical protein
MKFTHRQELVFAGFVTPAEQSRLARRNWKPVRPADNMRPMIFRATPHIFISSAEGWSL